MLANGTIHVLTDEEVKSFQKLYKPGDSIEIYPGQGKIAKSPDVIYTPEARGTVLKLDNRGLQAEIYMGNDTRSRIVWLVPGQDRINLVNESATTGLTSMVAQGVNLKNVRH